jgi:hypothetical protein
MNNHVFRKSAFLTYLVPILFTAGMIAMVMYGLSVTERSSQNEGTRILLESIQRAAITCYAIEGNYPGELSYIEENYGVRIDQDRYRVDYSIFASNVMPTIHVVERE